jgi:hypothetical protein
MAREGSLNSCCPSLYDEGMTKLVKLNLPDRLYKRFRSLRTRLGLGNIETFQRLLDATLVPPNNSGPRDFAIPQRDRDDFNKLAALRGTGVVETIRYLLNLGFDANPSLLPMVNHPKAVKLSANQTPGHHGVHRYVAQQLKFYLTDDELTQFNLLCDRRGTNKVTTFRYLMSLVPSQLVSSTSGD